MADEPRGQNQAVQHEGAGPDLKKAHKAMGKIIDALDLDAATRAIVVGWMQSLGITGQPEAAPRTPLPAGVPAPATAPPEAPSGDGNDGVSGSFGDFADFYHVANPGTAPERVLVAATWVQEREGGPNFVAQTVGALLKNLGYPIGNITEAFNAIMNRSPQCVIQTGKTGNAQQARKRYKVTEAGTREVRRMLAAKAEAPQ